MNAFLSKIKAPAAVLSFTVLIILISLIITAVTSGNANSIYIPRESTSDITDCDASLYEIFGLEEDCFPLPAFTVNCPLSFKTAEGKKYNEMLLIHENGSIDIKIFNYAYLIEDEMQRLPSDAEKLNWNGIDVFVYESKRTASCAFYTKGLISCMITVDGGKDVLLGLFGV